MHLQKRPYLDVHLCLISRNCILVVAATAELYPVLTDLLKYLLVRLCLIDKRGFSWYETSNQTLTMIM